MAPTETLIDEPRSSTTRRRRVIIVAPHFAPSNLASTHRSRLFGQHLPEFGWEPVIVTVDHSFYEEQLDWKLAGLVAQHLRVERVGALPTKPIRVVGDIGVRGFWPMLRRILNIIDRDGADFLYITVPSFFAAPLGRLAYELRGIPYGIDYSDPWVHTWPGSDRPLTKAWFSRRLGELLEPMSVRHASLITGVSDRTYRDVLARHPHLVAQAVHETMPYGGEEGDHIAARRLGEAPYLLPPSEKFRVIYAGTMWDNGKENLERMFRAIGANRQEFEDVQFVFIGTGTSPNDPQPQVRPLAAQFGLGEELVMEYPARIPYLDVLTHLEAADAILIIGSTKAHYTPSKVYQSILARRPIFAVLHSESPAGAILSGSRSGQLLRFNGAADLESVERTFVEAFQKFRVFARSFDRDSVDASATEKWSARSMTRKLAVALDSALLRRRPAHEENRTGALTSRWAERRGTR